MEPRPIRILKKIFHVPVRLPYYVQLDVTSFCNLSCKMCPRHHVKQELSHIDFDRFRKIIDKLKGTEEISLAGLGEPLVYPRIHDAIRYCKSKGLVTKITTNGLLLDSDEKIRALISTGLDAASFSIESIREPGADVKSHPNSTAVRNIQRLIELRKELGSATPKVAIQSVLIKGRERDIYEIIEWGARNGVDRVNVLRMTMYFETGLQRPNMGEEKAVFQELARLRKRCGIRIDCIQDQFFTGMTGFLYKRLKYFLGLDTFCVRLLDYPYITQKGDVIPCCILPDYKLGNVLEEDIKVIWRGERFERFRREHPRVELCSKCDNLRIKQFV